MTRLVRVTSAGLTLLLLYAVAVQYNDPDPLRWMAMYGAAAGVAAAAAMDRLKWPFAAVVAAVALAWALLWATRVVGQQPLFEEEGREMLGLTIAGVWCAILAYASFRSPLPTGGG